MKNKVNLTLLLFAFAIQLSFTESNLQQTASISIYADSILGEVSRNIFGTNIPCYKPQEDVLSDNFIGRMKEIKRGPVRWPGGNVGNSYNWKIDGLFRDTLGNINGVNIIEIANFCDRIGAELQIHVNFGTMNARDAADLVEFCNGPVTSEWGQIRASLGHPAPLNVKYWEIGNELYGIAQFRNSWTAGDAVKYYFGGSEERRGKVIPECPFIPQCYKGDLVQSNGSPNQRILIRFPDVAIGSDSVWVGPDPSNFVLWTRVDSLEAVGQENCYEMDYQNSVLIFGDGIHGNIPPAGHYILCEYTTINHDGYIKFVDSMKAVDPTIKIGPCISPSSEWSQDTLNSILQRMDFFVVHHYRGEDSTSSTDYYERMRECVKLLKRLYSIRKNINNSAGIYADSIGLALTEWNWIDFAGGGTIKTNVTLANALFTADVLGNLLTSANELKLEVANFFDAIGWGGNEYFGLIGKNYRRRPAFYAFKMFSDYFGEKLVHRDVVSDFYVVGNDAVPFITAYTSKSQSGDTLYLIVINKHDTLNYETNIDITGFQPDPTAYVHTLNGDSVYATNEEDAKAVTIKDTVITGISDSFNYTFPAHSVTAMEFVRNVTGISEHEALPEKFVLYQNYPNPFNPTTTIRFSLPQRSYGTLKVFDVLGREVATLVNGELNAGEHSVVFNAKNLPSSVYFYRLQAGNFVEQKKMVVVK